MHVGFIRIGGFASFPSRVQGGLLHGFAESHTARACGVMFFLFFLRSGRTSVGLSIPFPYPFILSGILFIVAKPYAGLEIYQILFWAQLVHVWAGDVSFGGGVYSRRSACLIVYPCPATGLMPEHLFPSGGCHQSKLQAAIVFVLGANTP